MSDRPKVERYDADCYFLDTGVFCKDNQVKKLESYCDKQDEKIRELESSLADYKDLHAVGVKTAYWQGGKINKLEAERKELINVISSMCEDMRQYGNAWTVAEQLLSKMTEGKDE